MVDAGSAPTQRHDACPVLRSVPSVLGLIALAAAGAWLAAGAESSSTLHAATSNGADSNDLDNDGLVDALELRLGTASDRIDTDADGYSDPEEVARGSSPVSFTSVPGIDPLGVGLEVYQEGGPLRLVSLLYVGDGDLSSKGISMGARVGSVVRTTPVTFFTQQANILTLGGKEVGSTLLVIDAPFDPKLVQRFGSLSFFTTLSSKGKVTDAGVVNVAWKDALLVEYVVEPIPGPVPSRQHSGPTAQGHYEPIDPTTVPKEWLPDQICAQTMIIAASVGPVVIQEVVEADCESGWDAYCDPACPATVGTTVETLDPGALIGG